MAKMIDKKPSWKGEGLLWDSLNNNLPSDNVVYNQREINGREYDFCVMAENMGILVIEVKGWDPDKVTVNGVDNIEVEGYDEPQTSPKKQARAYRFAILNKISAKYNVSPLVLDMVCYPFITEEQYKAINLDIVSEPEYTLFKEDIENGEKLNAKIQGVFNLNKFITHFEFTYDLMFRIRRSLEPALKQAHTSVEVHPYSKLRVFPDEVSSDIAKLIVEEYFDGIKQIVFVSSKKDFDLIISRLNSGLKEHNIDFVKNEVHVGFEKGISSNNSEDSLSVFNFSIYMVASLPNLFSQGIEIVEGKTDVNTYKGLSELALITPFNLQQYEIEHATTEKDILVEAGAGTGKTFSMVSRVAYLCNRASDAISNLSEEIAMVTFTNDAAINMKKRLKQMFINYFVLTGHEQFLKYVEDVDRSSISTIHKFAIGIMRGESLYTGLGTNFRISSDEYERGKAYDIFLGEFLEEMEAGNSNFVNELPVPIYDLKKKLMSIANKLLDKSINFESIKPADMGAVVDNNIPYFNDLLTKVVFPSEATYLESMKSSNSIDLKECLVELGRIFSNGCETIEDLRVKYLFIDEFQDTDDVQIEIFQKLQKCINADCKLFVVGDLKQSIYRFRGAKMNAFQRLQNGREMDWAHFNLNRNYRTDGRLLDIFDGIFRNMGSSGVLPYKGKEDQLKSDVLTDASDEELFVTLPCHGKDSEQILELLTETIAAEKNRIEETIKEKNLSREERTIAILVRSNWQVESVVKAAEKKDINVEISSGGDLYQLPSTLDLYKLLLAITHNTSPVYLVNFIESNYTNLKLNYQALRCLSEEEKLDEITKVLDQFFVKRMGRKWSSILDGIYSQPVLFALKQLFDELQPWQNYSVVPDRQRLYIANYEYLLEQMIKYSRIDALTLNQIIQFLSINILTGQQQLSRTMDTEDEGVHVICTTVHKSKGLEYGTVILPYTYEDISDTKKVKLEASFNDDKLAYTVLFENDIREHNSNFDDNKEVDEQVAEEARILYVAFTRTIRNCIWIQKENVERWAENEQYNIDHIEDILNDPDNYSESFASRLVVVINALFDEFYDKKVVLFTNYIETFEAYKKALINAFPEEEISFFGVNMPTDEIELSAYRFQNQKECRIILCDYTGGEGRNFQCADYVLHIDLPWDASAIEQRIGRLDRLERDMSRPVVYSVVVHTEKTFEDALFNFFKEGLHIFNQSLSGMEIIMKDINDEIISAIRDDFKYGLFEKIPAIVELANKMRDEIRKEQNFDAAGFIYRPMYSELRRLIDYYSRNENELFSVTMSNWASLAGFHGSMKKTGEITYSASSFSPRSAINSQLIPPKWNDYLSTEQNRFLISVQEAYR